MASHPATLECSTELFVDLPISVDLGAEGSLTCSIDSSICLDLLLRPIMVGLSEPGVDTRVFRVESQSFDRYYSISSYGTGFLSEHQLYSSVMSPIPLVGQAPLGQSPD